MVAIGLLASSGAAQTVEPVVSLDLPTTERLSAPQSPPGERAADRATTARGGLWGYVFAGPGVYRNEVTIDRGRFRGKHTAFDVVQETYRSGSYGGGVEWQVFKSVGVSGEVGTQIVSGYPHGMLSANVSYRFRSAPPEQPTLVPFVTGGYSLVDAPASQHRRRGRPVVTRRSGTPSRVSSYAPPPGTATRLRAPRVASRLSSRVELWTPMGSIARRLSSCLLIATAVTPSQRPPSPMRAVTS